MVWDRSPGGLLLSVDVDDVLHQQVPLQPVDAVAVQHHLMATGRTAETAAAGGAAGLPQRVRCLDTDRGQLLLKGQSTTKSNIHIVPARIFPEVRSLFTHLNNT